MKRYFLLVLLISGTTIAYSQQHTVARSLDTAFVKFFTGKWAGTGKFANGKNIAADLIVTMSLDSSWMQITYTDKDPNKYKAQSFWGVDQSNGEFIAYTFDNFHGHRKFSSEGWKNNKLILTTNQYNAQYGMLYQHFIYEKLNPDSLKITYEVSTDAISWRLGDSLVFKRQ
jgi:hypothetical protein